MATPEVQNERIVDYATAEGETDSLTVAKQTETVTGVSWFACYRPTWWISPAIGVAMLMAISVIYLGLRYEQNAVAWSGIVLFGLATCVLMVSFVRHAWLLACDLFGWHYSAKRTHQK